MDSLYYTSHMSPVKRKVLGDINNTGDSPISPTANLKLLTKVASQCNSIENINSTPPCKWEQKDLIMKIQVKTNLRKFKSLGYLCDKFLKMYPLDVPEFGDSHILLSNLARQLGVEKRRIYDIINVVESLQMATKIGKNSYTWTGHKKLGDTLSHLKAYAEQLGLAQYVQNEQLKRNLYLDPRNEEVEAPESCEFTNNANIAGFFRNERRIGILCQKFVMLFLVSLKDGLINLELAAKVLVGEDCQQNKTRLRRLYDIANILVSLGIIKKIVSHRGWKKPVFLYVGPPLHQMENFSYESSIISNWVKTELSDSISSDLSEDSNEVTPEEVESIETIQTDHSYCANSEVPQPAAKKRLVFSADSTGKVVATNTTPLTVVPNKFTVTTNCPRLLKVMGPVSMSTSISSGVLYKAVTVGNNIHFMRIEESQSVL